MSVTRGECGCLHVYICIWLHAVGVVTVVGQCVCVKHKRGEVGVCCAVMHAWGMHQARMCRHSRAQLFSCDLPVLAGFAAADMCG